MRLSERLPQHVHGRRCDQMELASSLFSAIVSFPAALNLTFLLLNVSRPYFIDLKIYEERDLTPNKG